jgi:hypothetical protein
LAWTDVENDVRWTRTGGVKGQPLMVAVEVGAEDTGSDSYRQSDKEGGGKKGVWIQLG